MKIWTTKNGEDLVISSMLTSHIENCIKYLENNPISYGGGVDADDIYFEEDLELTNKYITAFKKELKNRK